jgi:hypothetical protein
MSLLLHLDEGPNLESSLSKDHAERLRKLAMEERDADGDDGSRKTPSFLLYLFIYWLRSMRISWVPLKA